MCVTHSFDGANSIADGFRCSDGADTLGFVGDIVGAIGGILRTEIWELSSKASKEWAQVPLVWTTMSAVSPTT